MVKGRLRRAFAVAAFVAAVSVSSMASAFAQNGGSIYDRHREPKDVRTEIVLVAALMGAGLAGAVWLGCKIHDDMQNNRGGDNNYGDSRSRRFSRRR